MKLDSCAQICSLVSLFIFLFLFWLHRIMGDWRLVCPAFLLATQTHIHTASRLFRNIRLTIDIETSGEKIAKNVFHNLPPSIHSTCPLPILIITDSFLSFRLQFRIQFVYFDFIIFMLAAYSMIRSIQILLSSHCSLFYQIW